MNFEDQLQNLLKDGQPELNTDGFLNKLHATRAKRLRNRQRFTQGISATVIVLLVGVLTITQLDKEAPYDQYNQYYADLGMTEEMLEEYYDDLAVYLVEESDDIWATMEFFYETNYQPIKEIMETEI